MLWLRNRIPRMILCEYFFFPVKPCLNLYLTSYDMYSGESRHTSAAVDDTGTERDPDGTAMPEGPGVEVIEMANGETIW